MLKYAVLLIKMRQSRRSVSAKLQNQKRERNRLFPITEKAPLSINKTQMMMLTIYHYPRKNGER